MLSLQPKLLFSAKTGSPKTAKGPESAKSDTKQISKLRDELVKLFPGGEMRYSNGSGVGQITKPSGQSTKEVGIMVYHASDSDRSILVNYLLNNKVMTARNDGVYLYKGTPVGFEVVGEIRAGG